MRNPAPPLYDKKAVMNTACSLLMEGPQLEPTPDYTPERLTPSHSQSNLAQLHEVARACRTVETPSNVLDTVKLRAMPTSARFLHLLGQSKALIEVHGPYTTFAGTTVFSRAPLARNRMKIASAKHIALSLAAAQDSVGSAQIDGPANDDLAVFKYLWDTTVEMLESLIRTGDLDHETFGWGIFGLSAGYIGHASWNEDSLFLAHKTRLHDALVQMPSMDAPARHQRLSLSSGGHVGILAKANREIHVCANLLLQRFQREEWKRIRWYHGWLLPRSGLHIWVWSLR